MAQYAAFEKPIWRKHQKIRERCAQTAPMRKLTERFAVGSLQTVDGMEGLLINGDVNGPNKERQAENQKYLPLTPAFGRSFRLCVDF